MQRIGPTLKARHQNGFTLIELLIVVLIIGILASIAIPKFGGTKENAYMASMKSDLRNLITAQETYFSDNTTYTTDMGAAGLNISTTAGVSVAITVVVGPPMGFNATAAHIGTAETCAVFIATPAVAPAVNEGEPRCTN
jgi:prepilin-type N-terminal cleavage/methylation domain-containing protein